MNALSELNAYLARIEARLRRLTFWRGAAILTATALGATVTLVWLANRFAFSPASVVAAQWILYGALAATGAWALAAPLLKLNRRQAAERAEREAPHFEQRLLTLAERGGGEQADGLLELLAAETIEQTRVLPEPLATNGRVLAYALVTLVALSALIWLVLAGPGYMGYGASLLWAGPRRGTIQPYYTIVVAPGDAAVRRHSDQMIKARLVGFQASEVRLAARYEGSTRWEEAPMRPAEGRGDFELLLAGIPQSLDYYVSAGRIRSSLYRLRVVDLPQIKRLRVTYHFPRWAGLPPAVEDPGGDLRAVEGTEAEVAVETDRPLEAGFLQLGDSTRVPLARGEGNWRTARLKIQADGRYYVAALDGEQPVRLSEDYLILVEKDSPPDVRIRRPGRDARVSPIEEVTVVVEAGDEFGLQELVLHYSVNGGPERKVALLERPGARHAEGETTLYLEEFRLAPGDVVSLYATARDARQAAQTDIYFLEAQPFAREYSQSQQLGGGAGEGGQQDENRISERQKEIIAATWNQIRSPRDEAQNARFLADVQAKLRDQARSLARRMQSRELSRANQEFESFTQEMEKAAVAMDEASGKLRAARWREALSPEQQALQHLLRAEATFRQIQVAFGNRGGGRGGRGGAGRELESLFELELDTEKNQYETAQRGGPRNPEQRALDEALRKLEELARRQQELAERRALRQSIELRWQQEMLRREALELQREMERLAREAPAGAQGQAGTQARGDASAEREQLRRMGRGAADPRIEQALERLAQAAREMGRAAGQQQAADQLRQARDLLSGIQRREAGDRMNEMVRRSEQLAARQRDFQEQLRRRFATPEARASTDEAARMADEKQRMAGELEQLQRELEASARQMATGQRAVAAKLREALGDLQRQELATRMRYNAELIRRGWGAVAVMREAPVTAGLEQLRQQLREAQGALDRTPREPDALARALEALRRTRDRLAQDSGRQAGSGALAGRAATPGSQTAGAVGRRGGAEPAPGSYAASNFGDWQPAEPPNLLPRSDPAAAMRAYEQALRELSRLKTELRESPEAARELEQLLRDHLPFDPRRAPGNPALLERIYARFLADLDRLEIQWRRRLGEVSQPARTPASEPVPAGYAEAVAEYFRRLSQRR